MLFICGSNLIGGSGVTSGVSRKRRMRSRDSRASAVEEIICVYVGGLCVGGSVWIGVFVTRVRLGVELKKGGDCVCVRLAQKRNPLFGYLGEHGQRKPQHVEERDGGEGGGGRELVAHQGVPSRHSGSVLRNH